MDHSPRLSGEEWQLWADRLLLRHYGPAEYQRIPDNQKGDAGIEGFSITAGHAYQAYGPEEPLTTDERNKKHVAKMSTDIRKFRENKAKLAPMFGSVKIQRWILFVPYFDSKAIHEHAVKKTDEVLAANLPYVSSNFRVGIQDEQAFAVEREALLNADLAQIGIVGDEANQAAIGDWMDKNDLMVKTLDDKLSRLPRMQDELARRQLRDRIVKHFLEGQNALEQLRQYPQQYEAIRKAKGQRERYLVTEAGIFNGPNNELLVQSLEKIREAVKAEVRGVSEMTIDAVVWEAVSDWLIRCPLDFPKVAADA